MVLNNPHQPPLPFKPKYINQTILDKSWQGKNIENMIGAAQIPLGVAGPISLPGLGTFIVPLAATEAALVASINRGLKALRQSTRLNWHTKYTGMTRGPLFLADGLNHAHQAVDQIKNQLFPALQKQAAKVSRHIKLIKIQTQILGKYVFIRFRFDTDEAMGMNMVTYATEVLSQTIQDKLDLQLLSLSGNFCADKKFSFANFFFGRGHQVWIEAIIPKKTITDTLKTTPEKLLKIYQTKIIYGTVVSGSLTFNAHVANTLAAFYLATGQDIAHVAENAHTFFIAEPHPQGIYAHIFFPSLNLGTVGGGTGLPTQQEAIRLILAGLDSSYKGRRSSVLAVLVAAAALGAELSLLSALAENKLACSHKKFTGSTK
ncbi:MAG: 3-hydroxy-3-methylglutaryl-CoA reductase [bacterium]|nr:3-hydroxy-3-methylglutaryl-CoA reductase [bacterium]